MSKILSGPYGTLCSHQDVDPLDIGNPDVKAVHRASYGAYALHADIVATNTFRAKNVLRAGQEDRYREIIAEHVRLVDEILSPEQQIAVSFGPWGDCYKPEEAPSFSDGADFWEQAFATLLRIRGRVDIALAETINGDEADAITEAWRRVGKHAPRTELVTSLIPSPDGRGKLYNGEPLSEVAQRLQARGGKLPILGLNCFPIQVLEPALKTLAGHADVRLVYPNAADGDPKEYEGSSKPVISRTGEEVAVILNSIAQKFRGKFPDLAIGECCGGTPERTSILASRVNHQSHLSLKYPHD